MKLNNWLFIGVVIIFIFLCASSWLNYKYRVRLAETQSYARDMCLQAQSSCKRVERMARAIDLAIPEVHDQCIVSQLLAMRNTEQKFEIIVGTSNLTELMETGRVEIDEQVLRLHGDVLCDPGQLEDLGDYILKMAKNAGSDKN